MVNEASGGYTSNDNTVIKTMIELSITLDEADSIIEEFTQRKTYEDKFGFLSEQYPNISILGRCDGKNGNPIRTDYEAVLSTIINLKWR